MSGRLFVGSKPIIVETAEPIRSHDPSKGIWNIKIVKKILKNSWIFFEKRNPPKFENDFKWPTFRAMQQLKATIIYRKPPSEIN